MTRLAWCARIGASVVSTAALCACGSMRAAEHPQPAANAAPARIEAPANNAAPAAPPATDSGTAELQAEVRAPDPAPAPACVCAEVKPKAKTRRKPRLVHRDAPSPSTATVAAETSGGGVVDAQVRPMSVSVMSILGKRVQGPKGDDLGRVVDVLTDAGGRVRVAVIDFGGFLGVGNHRIAVDWPLLRFNPDAQDPSLLLSLSREKLQAAPEYKDNPRPQTLMEPPAPVTPAPVAPAPAAPASAPPAAQGK